VVNGRERKTVVKKKTCIHGTSAVLLSIMIASMVCVISSAPLASGSQEANDSLSWKEKLHPNDYAGYLASKLKSTFNTTYIDGSLELVYPIEYGGAYIDSSNNLHIVLSKYATNATIDAYLSIMGDPDVIFEVAEFPLYQLYELQDSIRDAPFRFDTAGVNEITNRLEIHLPNSTKPEEVIEFFKTTFADFDERCITLLGPNPITAGIEYTQPSAVPNDGFLGTNIPMIYGATAIAIIAVTFALACYLVFVRHAPKP
jgi:hypothetical protein